jgi:YD repeat-containing protein
MRGDRVEVTVDVGDGVKVFDVVATRAGRRVEVTTGRTLIEVSEITRGGSVVRTARFMTSRVIAGKAYLQTWDAENRLQTVTQGANVTTYTYDGDGNRVRLNDGTNTTVFIGGWYEKTGTAIRKYYTFWDRRVAMRDGANIYWLLADNLGSSNVSYKSDGTATAKQRYFPWGLTRTGTNVLPTD